MDRLQAIQNAFARVVCQAPSTSSATELRRILHWLPIWQRVEYKLTLIMYKTRLSGVSVYLVELLNEYQPSREVRSIDCF